MGLIRLLSVIYDCLRCFVIYVMIYFYRIYALIIVFFCFIFKDIILFLTVSSFYNF